MSRIFITSALPYINGVKHLGNLAGSMLPADVYARFFRAQGRETLFICATDEHGTPAELAAAAAGQDVKTYCDEQHALQADVCSRFGISWDHFGRSSSSFNAAMTKTLASNLQKNGFIEERTVEMLYSIDDGRFLPDRYVEGTCPKCSHPKARGDQCDGCGSLLDPTDLINPYSAISGSKNLELRETRHLYLLLSKMEPMLREWIETKTGWSKLAKSIALKHLDEGLQDRAITRDLSWGVDVKVGGEDKVFYVWFDAPICYLAATWEWEAAGGSTGGRMERSLGRWWTPLPEWMTPEEGKNTAHDVTHIQVMGKDNVAFHTVNFPATILGAKAALKTVDTIKAFNWLNWYGGKFSTSEKRGVFMDTALDIASPDVWRWYLCINAPENQDTAFTWEQFQIAANKDLADTLGNFVTRLTKFNAKRFGGVVPAGGVETQAEIDLHRAIEPEFDRMTRHLEELELTKAAKSLRAMWFSANEYLANQAPWKADDERAAVIVRTALHLLPFFARISRPFMPFTAEKLLKLVDDGRDLDWWPMGLGFNTLRPGTFVNAPEGVLFDKISDERLAELAETYGS